MTPTSKRLLIAGALAAAVVGFLLFRPDTLVTDVRVDEPLSAAFSASTTTAEIETTSGATNPMVTTTVATSEPVAVSAGVFSGIDHEASGSATIYQQDGNLALRFEDDTDIQNGPDLYVWLLPATSYEGGNPPDFLDLGKLKGNVGAQNYALPVEFDPEIHRTVLIWCLRFAVPFATAPLR